MPTSTAPWTVGDLVAGDYEVVRTLGHGGMGVVYLVRSRATGREYAVKRPFFDRHVSDRGREWLERHLLQELCTWADLPPHPHLAQFHFFTVHQGDLLLFSEYVPGGSLDQWITRGPAADACALLDLAIQAAWGLHAVHATGYVHRDVKPSNFLVTADGVVKATDFGLANALDPAGPDAPPDEASATEVPTVSYGPVGDSTPLAGGVSGTAHYCSPEQRPGQPGGAAADQWAWAITVWELFLGRVQVLGWGGLAAAEFAAWCRDPAHDPPRVPMPPAVAAVLQKCFGDVTQRWPDLAAAAAALSAVYADLRGQPYPRRPPDLAPRAATPKYERYLNDGNVFWQDPCHWLRLAAAWEGLDPESVMPPVPLGRGSRKVQSLADLAANLEADRRFRALLTHRPDRERLTAAAQLALELGWIHEAVGDPPGALPRYDRAIALWEELDEHEGLARALMSKAIALDVLGRGTEALPLFDRAIALLEPAAAAGGDLAKTLAAALLNKANALYYLGRGAEALPLFEQALDHFGRLVEQEGRADLADTLAAAVMNQASVLDSLGRGEEALPLFDRAIALRTRLVEQGGRAELADAVARAQMNKAVTLRRLGRETEALDLFDQVLALRGRLVEQEGLGELRGDLAWTRAYRAETLWGLGRPEEARAELAAALPVLEAEAARTRRADLDRIARWAGQRWQALRPEGQPCAS